MAVLKRVLGDNVCVGLDIGAQRIKTCALKINAPGQLELLGVYDTPTQGFRDSSVSDLGELTESIGNALAGLSRKSGIKIKDVKIGIGGSLIESRFCSAVIPLLDKGNKVIVHGDVKRVNHQASLLGVKLEEEILHDFPQHYRVDDSNTAINPVGLYGRKLEVHMLLILSQATRMNNIIKAVNQAGYDAGSVFFSSLACAESSLSRKMRMDGCVLVDMGAQMTNILIFKDGYLKYVEYLHVGGDHITKALAHELNLTFDLAEDIKKSYATVIPGDLNNEEEILIKKESSYLPLRRDAVCRSIAGEVERLVEGVYQSLQRSGLFDQMNAGIVMVGGGSLLSGLMEMIEAKTKLPVAIGKIDLASSKINNAALFSAAIGCAHLGIKKNEAAGLPNPAQAALHWPARLVHRLRELYQEYF